MRKSGQYGSNSTIPISLRQLEGLVRMSEAFAKLKLSDSVSTNDTKRAIDLMQSCLADIATDAETGKIDIHKLEIDMSTSQKNQLFAVKNIILKLEDDFGNLVPYEEILKKSSDQGINEFSLEGVLKKLKQVGDAYEPKPGFVSRIT